MDMEGLDPPATLAAMEATTVRARRDAVEELRLLVHWAGLHSVDPQLQPGAVPVKHGGDKLLPLGGEGTPWVSELCWAELAIARHAGVVATERCAADALDLAHRLPLVWEAVQDLRVEVWVARRIAAMSRALSREQVTLVDAAVAAAVDQSPGRLIAIAEAKVIEADPAAHRAKIAADAAEVGVRLSQPRPGATIDEIDGEAATRRLTIKAPTGTVVEVTATITEIADLIHEHLPVEEAETITRGQLETKAVELMSNPHAAAAFLDQCHGQSPGSASDDDEGADPAPLPATKKKRPATIYVHLSDLVLSGTAAGVARVEGMGPMLLEQLRDLLAQREISLQPVIDLNHTHSVNGYEHPTLVKERTLLRMLGDAFPHTTNSAYRRLDHDHPTPYVRPDTGGPPGQTGDHNDAPLTRRHHRIKTHADNGRGYDLRQLGLGTYRWITPHGLGRLVTLAGTRRFEPLRGSDGSSIGELYFADRAAAPG